jgi:hypothetical protein
LLFPDPTSSYLFTNRTSSKAVHKMLGNFWATFPISGNFSNFFYFKTIIIQNNNIAWLHGFRFYQHNQCGISWHRPCIQSCSIVLPSESARTTPKCIVYPGTEANRIFYLMLRLQNLLKSFQLFGHCRWCSNWNRRGESEVVVWSWDCSS